MITSKAPQHLKEKDNVKQRDRGLKSIFTTMYYVDSDLSHANCDITCLVYLTHLSKGSNKSGNSRQRRGSSWVWPQQSFHASKYGLVFFQLYCHLEIFCIYIVLGVVILNVTQGTRQSYESNLWSYLSISPKFRG